MTALVLCLWTSTFTLIANFAPSGATVSRYYCEVDSAELFVAAVEEISDLTTNTSPENRAVIKLIDNIKIADIDNGYVQLYSAAFENILNDMSEDEQAEWYADPYPLTFVTLDLNGHVLWFNATSFLCQSVELEIIDSNPTAENVLPDGTTVTGGAVYGDSEIMMQIVYGGSMIINGGNFYGDMFLYLYYGGNLTLNQGVIKCQSASLVKYGVSEITGVAIAHYANVDGNLFINGGQIDCAVTIIAGGDDGAYVVTDPEIIDQCITVDEKKVAVKKDSFGNIIGYAEKVNEPEPTPEDPENPENPDEQDPVENPTEQKPSDNKTPVISGTTDNGQPTSDDFMQIMMIGILVIVALSVVSIAASLLIIKKYRPRVA